MKHDPIILSLADPPTTSPSTSTFAQAVSAADSTALVHRVFDCLPSGCFAMNSLLRLLRVTPSTDVETAAVECRARPRLLINPLFVDRWCPTAPRLRMLVMHELHHVLLGHTRLFPRATHADNLVFDAVINALLCRMFPTPDHWSFFTDYYPDDQFPHCLLRPPAGWTPELDPIPLPPALQAPQRWQAANVYRSLYSKIGAGYQELYDALRLLLDENDAASVPLLGDHKPVPDPQDSADGDEDDPQERQARLDSADGDLEHRLPEAVEIVRDIVERWPQPPQPIPGRSLSELLQTLQVHRSRRPSPNRPVLRRLFRCIAADRGDAAIHPGFQIRRREIISPVPTFDRRSVVQRALGSPPLLFSGSVLQQRPAPRGERVHVYLDVSGSVAGICGALYGAVLDCARLVHPVVHLFSTEVADVTLEQLRRGHCPTTGGTSIECVAEHLRRHRVRRAVLITDGYVGQPSAAQRQYLAGVVLGVALTPGSSNRSDLAGLARHWAQLLHQAPELQEQRS